ncbi:hypothetical protein [Actinomadura harenae]|uniref:XRE family transcriptional regulator n=1 Tax=Actinomadura harenae TaxID=2483351 RepID=A0A3M2LKP4_9ACTN|nr:hypothetical protein [Actinomadura harenae]RMI36605.1 hypothetical protein EBO15_38110 [Actinomadura harenae]
MPTVRVWTGRETRALRHALRQSVRVFAQNELGVAVRTVSKWEHLGAATQPRPDTQAILDTTLQRASPEVQARFELFLRETGGPAAGVDPVRAPCPQAWEYETWTDDLERAAVLLSRQKFPAATNLLHRWLTRFPCTQLDDQGRYLHARSLVLLGDAQRDQGVLLGPASAGWAYDRALSMFADLDVPRRVAQVELALAVVAEMHGDLQKAARRYEQLAGDQRLSSRDRARALLWVGTALSKDGDHDHAVQVMTAATHQLENLDEGEDWSVAQQKIALAHRGAGRQDQAQHFIDLAHSSGTDDTPMQRVRLATAHAHILLSDRATCDHGLAMLHDTARLALSSGLSHQTRAITAIRRRFETGAVTE